MIRIITDSTSDITPEEAKKLNIDVVPLYVVIGDKNYKDRVELQTDEFYEKLKDSSITTSQPSPMDFLAVYDKYQGDEIICITCTHKLSGTYQSANVAKNSSDNENITVIDSETISLGLRNVILEAVRIRDEKNDVKSIVEHINKVKNKSFIMGSLESLEYLKRGGRISSAAAIFGTVLNVKPILQIRDGSINVHKKKMRGKQNAMKFITKLVKEISIDKTLPISIGYSSSADNAHLLMDKLQSEDIVLKSDEDIVEVGPVVGTHVGEGCYFVAFFTAEP